MEIWFGIANGQILSIFDSCLPATIMIVAEYSCFIVLFDNYNQFDCKKKDKGRIEKST